MDFNEIEFDPRTMTLATPADVERIRMSLTKNLRTTGHAAVIEKRDFQDSITPREPRSVADEIATLKLVYVDLLINAEECPEFATSLLAQAEKIQSRINALEDELRAQEQDAEVSPLVAHEISALEKMRAELLTAGGEYNVIRANRIPDQIKSMLEANR
jgi:hypothetical protein